MNRTGGRSPRAGGDGDGREIETRKGTLAPDDPAMLELSAEAEHLSKHIAAKASAEHDLAKEVSEASEAPEV